MKAILKWIAFVWLLQYQLCDLVGAGSYAAWVPQLGSVYYATDFVQSAEVIVKIQHAGMACSALSLRHEFYVLKQLASMEGISQVLWFREDVGRKAPLWPATISFPILPANCFPMTHQTLTVRLTIYKVFTLSAVISPSRLPWAELSAHCPEAVMELDWMTSLGCERPMTLTQIAAGFHHQNKQPLCKAAATTASLDKFVVNCSKPVQGWLELVSFLHSIASILQFLMVKPLISLVYIQFGFTLWK
ncbi:hypothetical protein OG21DRAFT_1527863 [Imleria badia]|nr:hypothetical protein OG21DRAFT_1527863 [Imleria badia]